MNDSTMQRYGRALALIAAMLGSGLAGCGGGGGGGGGGDGSPTAGSFSTVASMSAARYDPSSALLPNGKVIVAGGFDNAERPLATTEIFDPVSGQWTAGQSMSLARVGGFLVRLNSGKVMALEGRAAEAYDAATNRWTALANPPGIVSAPYLLLTDGRVLAFSGLSGQALVYDPVANSWRSFGGFDGRHNFGLTQLTDGRVLISGGASPGGQVKTATTLLFDPATGAWQTGPNMHLARADHFSFRLPDGRVVVSHGSVASLTPGGTTEVYDPVRNAWTVAGDVIKFDSSTFGASGTALGNGRFLVTGGRDNGGVILDQRPQGLLNVTNAEIFDPVALSWQRATTPPGGPVGPRYYHSAVRLDDGRVLLAGGLVTTNTELASAEIYHP